jgi:DNA topoisomerase I
MSKFLVIVESPAKCKTISKFLGNQYELLASYGHVRDLPGKSLGIDVEKNFSPSYSKLKDKQKILKELSAKAKKSDLVYLATDPDREGEAIAWHIVEAINLPKSKIKRIVFNEITETAVKDAMKTSREINTNLVNAQQARRVLDRLIGYKLSPILSRKIQRGLSAGRVQSVAVKIICDREKIILAFESKEYWVIQSKLQKQTSKDTFTAKLVAKDTLKNKYEATTEKEAKLVEKNLNKSNYVIDDITKSNIKKNPPLPFITSTLQQEASRKLSWTAKKTMMVAQRLYEGQEIEGEPVGLITYMRTDSTRIADSAKSAAATYIKDKYDTNYLGYSTIKKKGKSNIQDAHEAIRPSDLSYSPERIEKFLENDFFKLYKLIWNRFLASQMAPALYDRTQVVVKASSKDATYFLRSSGSILKFDGFTRIYTEGLDDKQQDENKENLLPELEKNEEPKLNEVTTEQKFTQPPPRFSEATLVKELEELGIGRPSTYAPTISTIQDRGYIVKEQKKLCPSELGMVTNDQLEAYFNTILDLEFTANMENQLDEVQEGKLQWQEIVSSYYSPLEKMIDNANKTMEKVSVGERQLGPDPDSGKEVIVKIGRYGPMAQIGSTDDEEKPKFASIDSEDILKTITLEEALALFDFPKTIGQFEGKDIIVNRGRYGPYVKYDNGFISIPETLSINSITTEDALELIAEKKKKDKERIIHDFSDTQPPIQVLNGKYGPYINQAKKNFKIPKEIEPKSLTLEKCLDIIKNQKKKKKK